MTTKYQRRLNQQQRRRPGYRRNRTIRRAMCRKHGVVFFPNRPEARYIKWTERRPSPGHGITKLIDSVRGQIKQATGTGVKGGAASQAVHATIKQSRD